jgi:septum formation protein
MPLDNLSGYKVILASQSPRRRELLAGLDIDFEIEVREVVEDFPNDLPPHEIPEYLAKLKASAFDGDLEKDQLLITSDTVVELDGRIFNKPATKAEAIEMLSTLSGKTHRVYTGVCLTTTEKQEVFHDMAEVTFCELELDEIESYIDKYKPFDKAGSYGIQEWLGYAAIDRIEGSFYNVMGLPTRELYKRLKKF